MSTTQPRPVMQLPASLEVQLLEFRRRVWTIKSIECLPARFSASQSAI